MRFNRLKDIGLDSRSRTTCCSRLKVGETMKVAIDPARTGLWYTTCLTLIARHVPALVQARQSRTLVTRTFYRDETKAAGTIWFIRT
jgi:hypothetical protein